MTHGEAFRIWRQDAKGVDPKELRKAIGHIYGCDQCFTDFLGEREYGDSGGACPAIGGAVAIVENPQPQPQQTHTHATPADAPTSASWVDDLCLGYQEFFETLKL